MSVVKTIAAYFKARKQKAVLIAAMIAVVTALSLIPAQVLRLIVDDAIENTLLNKLALYSLIYSGCFLLVGVVTFIKDVVMLSTSQGITKSLRENMMKHVHKMTYKSLSATDSGTLEAYFNNDVNAINDLFTSGVISMVTDAFKILGILITIFIYSEVFGFIMLAVLPVLIVFTSFVRKRMLKAQLKTKTLEGSVNKTLLESVENVEQIKVNRAENYAKAKYGNILKNHFFAAQASNFYDALFSPVMQIVRNLVVVAILLISGYNSSFFGMTIGMIISAISLVTDLFSPIENLGMEIQTIQKSLAAVERIDKFFSTETETQKADQAIKNVDLVFQNVSFSYDDKPVIENFSLSVSEGEKIAFQGVSGGSKSTLVRLAMGQAKPNDGRVTIGGVDTYLLSDAEKKKLFSVVYQEPFFSGGTIYEEISLLDKSVTKEAALSALQKVGLSGVGELDQKFVASNYSSGELALFNIARVVARDTKIVFLDEMNAKIDPITAKAIIELLNDLTKNKIVISINHYGVTLKGTKIVKIG